MANLNNDDIDIDMDMDMDMDSVRVERAKNQCKFYGLYPNSSSYPTIGSFAGQSAPERFLGLRQVLFPFPSIDREGTPPGQLISRKVEAHHFFYPRIKAVAEELLPSLFNLIDETYEDIGMIDNQDRKDDAALRLVSVLYSLGITIHPALDGNGQTFKAMVLTYLHELTSVYRGKYFAIKFSSELHDKDTEIETLNLPKKFAELNIPKVEPANEEDRQLLEMFQDLSLMRTISPGENIKWQDNLNELEVQIYTLAKKNADQFKLPNLIERSTTSQNQHSPKLRYFDLVNNLSDIFIDKGYDPDRVRATFKNTSSKMASTTILMLVLLSRKDNPNLRLIKDYILGIPIELGITDELGAEVFQIAKDQFDAVGRSINELLMDNTISSESAVRKQKELAERYKVLANWLENIKVNNIGTWSSIIDELDRLPEGATLESKIEFLEFKFSSNYPKTT